MWCPKAAEKRRSTKTVTEERGGEAPDCRERAAMHDGWPDEVELLFDGE